MGENLTWVEGKSGKTGEMAQSRIEKGAIEEDGNQENARNPPGLGNTMMNEKSQYKADPRNSYRGHFQQRNGYGPRGRGLPPKAPAFFWEIVIGTTWTDRESRLGNGLRRWSK